jgi:ABC-type bacteriocin/lantibiotic exporter with double-glycine peptidase domain
MVSHRKEFFNNISFWSKKRILGLIVLITISSIIVASFPAITQVYLVYLYPSGNVNFLLIWSLLFVTLFLIKLLIDIRIEINSAKYFSKLEKRLKEKIFQNMIKRRSYFSKKSFSELYESLQIHTSRYVLFVRKVIMDNYVAIVKIIFITVVMSIINFYLFLHSLFFIPIFVVYLFMFNRHIKKNKEKISSFFMGLKTRDSNILGVIEAFRGSTPSDQILKSFRRTTAFELEKDLGNKRQYVPLNQSLKASISIFRVLFLGYFGFFIMVQGATIQNLIVGLLYIAILARCVINILESLLFYHICKSAIKKVHYY